MKLPQASGQPPPADSGMPGAELLAASVAHELNNIAASLRGFIELARDGAAMKADATLGGVIDEMRIGVERVAALGADLNLFAAGAVSPQPVSLAECTGAGTDSGAVTIRWDCDAGLQVHAAAPAVRLAIATLARFADREGMQPVTLVCHLAPAAVPATCVSCGATTATGAACLTLPRSAIRGRPAALPEPGRDCLSPAELRFAALDHAIHSAGGHLLVHAASGAISLLMPLARTADSVT